MPLSRLWILCLVFGVSMSQEATTVSSDSITSTPGSVVTSTSTSTSTGAAVTTQSSAESATSSATANVTTANPEAPLKTTLHEVIINVPSTPAVKPFFLNDASAVPSSTENGSTMPPKVELATKEEKAIPAIVTPVSIAANNSPVAVTSEESKPDLEKRILVTAEVSNTEPPTTTTASETTTTTSGSSSAASQAPTTVIPREQRQADDASSTPHSTRSGALNPTGSTPTFPADLREITSGTTSESSSEASTGVSMEFTTERVNTTGSTAPFIDFFTSTITPKSETVRIVGTTPTFPPFLRSSSTPAPSSSSDPVVLFVTSKVSLADNSADTSSTTSDPSTGSTISSAPSSSEGTTAGTR